MNLSFKVSNWKILANIEDGGRICSLEHNGFNFLTPAPKKFKEPSIFLGEYEKRPVYGYDDCFPSVVSCKLPGFDFEVADHGNLCWNKWNIYSSHNSLIFSTSIKELKLKFNRKLIFNNNHIIWKYQIINNNSKDLPYIHAPHPLMPTMNVKNLYLPNFKKIYDIQKQYLKPLPNSANELAKLLVNSDKNSVFMLYLIGIDKKEIVIEFKNDIKLKINFDHEDFTTLAIWWNRLAYPDEDGIRRDEFAIEPLTGYNSSLIESMKNDDYRIVKANSSKEWEIKWEVLKYNL